MKNKITILTEAGAKIGFGHYSRCLAIKECLKAHNIYVTLVLNSKEFMLCDNESIISDWTSNYNFTISSFDNEIVIVDSYLASKDVFVNLKKKFNKVVVLDDYNRAVYDADIIINPNVYFNDINYSNQSASCFGGKDYVILRKQFREANIKVISKNCSKILVTLGGSDYRNLLPIIVECANYFSNLEWTFIIPESKSEICNSNNFIILNKLNANEMAIQFSSNDVVISACGQTLHELVAMRKPTIGICIDHDQIPNQNYYFNTGFLLNKNFWNDLELKQNLISQLKEIMSYSVRENVYNNSKDLINKHGVFNVINQVIKQNMK